MSEQIVEPVEDFGQPATNGELVHWMAKKPLRIGPTAVTAMAGGAFVLGVTAAVAVLALAHWLGPQRKITIARGWRRRG